MNSTKTLIATFASLLMFAGVARSGAGAILEELAVVQAIAQSVVRESTRPYDYLYFESEFSARKNVAASLADPDRTQFCGLSREGIQRLIKEITLLNLEPVEYDKTVATQAGLGLGHKKFERFRYLKVSRVVFADDGQQAWLAVDLNGESGAMYKLDKTGGQWSRTARCGGWVRAAG